MQSSKRLKSIMTEIIKIGTHSGHFHCDEILACYMLKQLPEYKDAVIVRSRDPAVLDQCEIVVDVGAMYDPARNRFDHHQRSFAETFASLNSAKPWTIKLSSAGLVYVHFGKQVLGEILKKHNAYDEKLLEIVYDKIYEKFVREVDAIDNGVEVAETRAYEITTNLSTRVSYFNPAWNQEHLDENKQFHLALDYVGNEFEDRVKYYALIWWPVRSVVEKAIEDRFKIDESGTILLIETVVPWKSHLFDLEKELGVAKNEIKYVVYQDKGADKSFRVQCVPISDDSFVNRLSLPAEWCGLRDAELSKKSGIAGCVFVHANGFIGGNKTYEGALEMLRRSLKLDSVAK